MDEDIFSWGIRSRLPEAVINGLLLQGYGTLSELCQLNEDDLEIYFLESKLFTEKEFSDLMAALMLEPTSLLAAESNMPTSHRTSASPAAGQASWHRDRYEDFPHRSVGHSGDGAISSQQTKTHVGDDFYIGSYDADDFEYIHASMAAAVVREEAPREFCGPLTTRPAPDHGTWGAACAASDGDSDLDLETVRLLLAGKTGNGKSSTGNTILGKKLFDTAPDFGSVTCECERQVAVNRNKRMEVMDTPGLYDTNKSHEEICTIIVQAVAGMHPGPHAVLFVIKVGRFTPEEYAAYRRLKALFDDTIVRHIILLFTHGDYLEREGSTLQDLIRSPKTPENLREVFRECGNRYVVFNNTVSDTAPQVDTLLQLVQSMVVSNGGQPYVCPKYSKIGEGLEEEVNKRMEAFEKKDLQRQKYVQTLEQKTRDTENAADLMRQEFEQMEHQREIEMERLERERRRVQKDLEQRLQKQQHHTDKQRQEVKQLKKEMKRKQEEQEHMQKEHAKKRKAELKEMERNYKALERKREEAREEDRRRDRARAKEMERLKASVVRKEEPGILSKGVDFIAGGIKKVFGFFGL